MSVLRVKRNRTVKNKILIFVESKTEETYLNSWRQLNKSSSVKIVKIKGTGRYIIKTVLSKLSNDKSLRDYKNSRQIVVFDKDELSVDELQSIQKHAELYAIELGFSNICFEVWLLAHYERMSKSKLSTEMLNTKLGQYLHTTYKKGDSKQLDAIASNYEIAIKNAEPIAEISFDGQCTNVGKIFNSI